MAELTRKQKIALYLLILVLLGFMLVQPVFQGYSLSGKELEKTFVGNAVNTITNVKVTMSNGTVVFNGSLPASGIVDVKNVWHGQTATIQYTWGEGTDSETVGPIGCDDGVFRVTNIVNHTPKLGL